MGEIARSKEPPSLIDRLHERYIDSPGIRALVQLIPYGSPVDAYLSTRWNNIQEARVRAFFDELERTGAVLSPALIESEDFLHCYTITLRAVTRTRRREKIRMFSGLLATAVASETLASVDEYEDTLSVLDELSYREIQLLTMIEATEAEAREYSAHLGNNAAPREAISRRRRFHAEVAACFGIDEEDIYGLLSRLQRTGMFRMPGIFLDGDDAIAAGMTGSIGIGELTGNYHRFRERIGHFDTQTQGDS